MKNTLFILILLAFCPTISAQENTIDNQQESISIDPEWSNKASITGGVGLFLVGAGGTLMYIDIFDKGYVEAKDFVVFSVGCGFLAYSVSKVVVTAFKHIKRHVRKRRRNKQQEQAAVQLVSV